MPDLIVDIHAMILLKAALRLADLGADHEHKIFLIRPSKKLYVG